MNKRLVARVHLLLPYTYCMLDPRNSSGILGDSPEFLGIVRRDNEVRIREGQAHYVNWDITCPFYVSKSRLDFALHIGEDSPLRQWHAIMLRALRPVMIKSVHIPKEYRATC